MTLTSDTGEVVLANGLRIGRVEPWPDDPGVFDGWLEIDGETDRLVVNGSNRSWAVHEVARHFVLNTMELPDGIQTASSGEHMGAWRDHHRRMQDAKAATTVMVNALSRHLHTRGKG